MSRVRLFTAMFTCGVLSLAASAQAQDEAPKHHLDFAAMHREFCTDHMAHKAAALAYTAAKLNLTSSQRSLWDSYYQSVMTAARSEESACLQSPTPTPGVHPTILEHQSREVQMLQARLAAMQSSEPSLAALYQALTPEQKAILDAPHHHGFGHHGMMGHGMMDGHWAQHDGQAGGHSYQ